ncbi:DUF84 family protein [Candidatus Pacearchaeota archaeon]|nr:DUF84 family protein [Candidatus Pacearchaeota archaeon]
MIINLGSKNPVKIKALEEVIKEYPILANALVNAFEVSSGISRQPKSFDETIEGAYTRAVRAFTNCAYSFGIEGGLVDITAIGEDYSNLTACVVYDGKKYFLGLSSGFQVPQKVSDMIRNEGLELDEAVKVSGITSHSRIGYTDGGFVGLLTKGRVTRKDYIKQAIRMALIGIENPELY